MLLFKRRSMVAALGLCIAWFSSESDRIQAQTKYTPDSPEVKAMVDKAIGFIRTQQPQDVGLQVLNALAICEATKRYDNYIPHDDPQVITGVSSAARVTLNAEGETEDALRMYEPCLCGILLALVDSKAYQPNIEALLRRIEKRQQVGGSWGYSTDGTARDHGDTSQTQYCCLSMWMANNAGIPVNNAVAERAIRWLFATQTGAGGWRYRASAGGGGGRGGGLGLGSSGGETLSLASAGAGSVYMCADILGAGSSLPQRRNRRSASDLPAIITEYVAEAEETDTRPRDNSSVDGAALRNCTSAANRWFKENFTPDASTWRYYYLYGFERYAYFREKMEGQVYEIPDWYDQGVDFLMSVQTGSGSFVEEKGDENVPPSVSTVFAVLFLVRSTELLAGDPATGDYQGGQGLGRGSLKLRGGKIEGEAIERDVADFLKAIESGQEQDLAQFTDSLTRITLPTDPAKRAQYMQQMRVLVSDEDFEKRFIAVKTLSTVRDLDNVPVLIYALTDPAPDVIKMAHKGLRFISRKIDSIRLPDNPTAENMRSVKKQWEDWYKSVRPDGELLYEGDK